MTETNFWITFLQKSVTEYFADFQVSLDVYLFGSALRRSKPHDIDLLLVYPSSRLPVAAIGEIRRRLAFHLRTLINLDIDICLLNTEELQQSKFAEIENAVLICSIHNIDLQPACSNLDSSMA